jgi:hypothetical protein
MLKLLLSGLLALSPVASEHPDVVFQNLASVYRVDCDSWRGTAFRVGPNHFLSVAHVTSGTHCNIAGKPTTVTEQDGANDFAQLNADIRGGKPYAIDCGGFVPGRWYWAAGYAFGAMFQTNVAIYATYAFSDNGERVFMGMHTVIPGMSGGPVIDPATGAVVGTVNMYDPENGLSFSRELKGTSVCRH